MLVSASLVGYRPGWLKGWWDRAKRLELNYELKHGQGTFIYGKGKLEGQKYEGEYKDGFYWNGTLHDKDENIVGKYVNGKMWKQ